MLSVAVSSDHASALPEPRNSPFLRTANDDKENEQVER